MQGLSVGLQKTSATTKTTTIPTHHKTQTTIVPNPHLQTMGTKIMRRRGVGVRIIISERLYATLCANRHIVITVQFIFDF